MRGFEPGIDLQHLREASQEKAGGDKQHHRHSHLDDHHAASQTRLSAAVARAVAAVAE
jgi:hypothetical protein